jgi:hypothetical protein
MLFTSEKAIFYARAVVYYFDTASKSWTPTPVGNGFSRVDMYENTSNSTFRVIGRGLQDPSKVIMMLLFYLIALKYHKYYFHIELSLAGKLSNFFLDRNQFQYYEGYCLHKSFRYIWPMD